jgi:Ca-activated chloride channel homolog
VRDALGVAGGGNCPARALSNTDATILAELAPPLQTLCIMHGLNSKLHVKARPFRRVLPTLLLLFTASFSFLPSVRGQEPARPTFSTSVAVVPITAVVRDARNRVVRNLEREDFRVLEQGAPRRIIEFSASDDGPVSLAFLFDTSGSMGVTSNLAKGKEVIAQLLVRMRPERDEAALFTFQKSLREEVRFTSDQDSVQRALDEVRPWGLTSLYDAVAETAKRLTDRAARRAIVVVSDGVDTSSTLSSRDVARLASEIDVPVYVVAVVSPLDHPRHPASVVPEQASGGLLDLAELSGGDVFYVSGLDSAAATDALLNTVRHQYFLAIESAAAPGWYPLEVKTKRQGLTVRARRAYSAGVAGDDRESRR